MWARGMWETWATQPGQMSFTIWEYLGTVFDDKLKFKALTDTHILDSSKELSISIIPNIDSRTLTIKIRVLE